MLTARGSLGAALDGGGVGGPPSECRSERRRAPRPPAFAGSSRRQSSGRLSSRSPRNVGWRMPPSAVHSVNRTSQTSFGSTQWWPLQGGVQGEDDELVRDAGAFRSEATSGVAL